MKYNYYIIYTVLIIFFFYKIDNYFYNERLNQSITLKSVFKTLKFFYPKKINIDDNFSREVYNTFFERIDPLKIYLTKKDINIFIPYKGILDESFIQGDLSFFNNILDFFFKRIYYLEILYYKILDKPFNLTRNDKIIISSKDINFSKDYKELKNRIRLYLKYLTILEMDSIKKSSNIINLIDLEKKARNIVLNNIKDHFKKLKIQKKTFWFSLYINSIISQYDPHTNYFSEEEKNIFDMSISGQLEGIGIQIEDKNKYITIINISIGGPAWKSKKIEIGDKIIKISQDNKKEINVIGTSVNKCINYIKGQKGSKIFLTIKKKNGNIIKVTLIRDLIEQKEIFTKSLLILDKKNKKHGLIKLPEFYFNYNEDNGRDVFKDVKLHLELLKKEGINGLIIDLRNNGGGSLESVIKILGLFINNRPVLQIKNIDGNKEILQTDQKNYIWDGPLVIIVNKLTASAAEIFSSTIKDYNRGIIIGDSNTFGKGSIQTLYPLNNIFNIRNNIGFLKFTISKFYSINGNSIQLKGVNPDIIIPYDYLSENNYYLDNNREIDQKNSMPFDTITPISYQPYLIDNKNIINKSNNRIKNNKNIKKIQNKINQYKLQKNKLFINLNWKKFNNDKKNIENIIENINYLNNKYLSKVKFYYLKKDCLKNCLINKKSIKKYNDDYSWYKSLFKDFFIEESVNILTNYIQPKKTFN